MSKFNEFVLQDFDGSVPPSLKKENTKIVSDIKEARDEVIMMKLEIKRLRNRTSILQERVKSLEMQLLEYYGLRGEKGGHHVMSKGLSWLS